MTPAGAERPPVSVITGYLGSGKTTLLNRLLRDPALANTAVIINEFGEIALDHLLVAAPSENMVLLANGCICCAVRGDLVGTLGELADKRERGETPPFDRVLIETTGLADPVPVLQTLITDPEVGPRYRLDGVLTLVDGAHGAAQLDAHREAVKQAALADRLLISKCDVAPGESVAALERRLATLNPGAQRFRVTRGEISPDELFGVAPGNRGAEGLARWLRQEAYVAASAHRDSYLRPGRHDDGIDAFSVYLERPVTRVGLVTWLHLLASLRGANLLRMKGLLNVEGHPMTVHAVQTLIDEPVALAQWPDEDRRSRLVFITRDMARADIERTLDALGFEAGAPLESGGFDPRAYERFVAVAKNFR
ncbi:MAG: GTP-binding protein [Betaproteobacteria bacterium]|nr:MAG: GTP-binding protein [Betaproteobacteria bacterium]